MKIWYSSCTEVSENETGYSGLQRSYVYSGKIQQIVSAIEEGEVCSGTKRLPESAYYMNSNR